MAREGLNLAALLTLALALGGCEAFGRYKQALGTPETALFDDSANGDLDLVTKDLKKIKDIDAKIYPHREQTALIAAAANGRKAVVEYLLKHGASAKAADVDGNTALHFAAQARQTEICAILIAHGAEAGAKNLYGLTPLKLAENNGDKKTSELLRNPSAAEAPAAPQLPPGPPSLNLKL